jgi:signal transduction histidine kinase
LAVEHALQASQGQLRALAARIEETREQERSEVARELHDELGQSLTAIKMDLRWLEKRLHFGGDEVKDKIAGLVGLTDGTIQTVQRLASRLRPGLLDDLGLAAAIEWLGAECSRHAGISCDVSVDIPERLIGPKSTTAIFRIVQEALTNVTRHASASRVSVRLRQTGGYIEALVEDDGAGIAEAQASDSRSFGLMGIRERAQAIGGRVAIRGEPGKGTSVHMTVALPGEGALP